MSKDEWTLPLLGAGDTPGTPEAQDQLCSAQDLGEVGTTTPTSLMREPRLPELTLPPPAPRWVQTTTSFSYQPRLTQIRILRREKIFFEFLQFI